MNSNSIDQSSREDFRAHAEEAGALAAFDAAQILIGDLSRRSAGSRKGGNQRREAGLRVKSWACLRLGGELVVFQQ
jgi:hypothetical protein